jgi:ParB-like chromosome segregation protein Spo0J
MSRDVEEGAGQESLDSQQAIRVHPFAAEFPMMSNDELHELADDIRANGLRQPIMLDRDGQLIDGRNRLAACTLAGVEPTYTTLPDAEDAEAYIVSANTQRRNLSKGQEAMVVARTIEQRVMVNAPSARLADVVNVTAEARRYHTHRLYLGFAVTVLQHAPDLAEQVKAGTMSLPTAYQAARARQGAMAEPTAKARAEQLATARKLGRLQREAPDLHEQVVASERTLADALVEFGQRVLRDTRVHPFDAKFPLLPEEAMKQLVASVEAEGLHHPIVYDRDGVLIDGKNRLVACARAGFEPTTTVLPEGVNPITHILSANVRRMHHMPLDLRQTADRLDASAGEWTRLGIAAEVAQSKEELREMVKGTPVDRMRRGERP